VLGPGAGADPQDIQDGLVDRVVVAACTPRTHEPIFRKAIEKAGLNKYLFEMANIRDQGSWVHPQDPEGATEKAKKIVASAPSARPPSSSPWKTNTWR
jgi:heterodisulfide reductase subunit A2